MKLLPLIALFGYACALPVEQKEVNDYSSDVDSPYYYYDPAAYYYDDDLDADTGDRIGKNKVSPAVKKTGLSVVYKAAPSPPSPAPSKVQPAIVIKNPSSAVSQTNPSKSLQQTSHIVVSKPLPRAVHKKSIKITQKKSFQDVRKKPQLVKTKPSRTVTSIPSRVVNKNVPKSKPKKLPYTPYNPDHPSKSQNYYPKVLHTPSTLVSDKSIYDEDRAKSAKHDAYNNAPHAKPYLSQEPYSHPNKHPTAYYDDFSDYPYDYPYDYYNDYPYDYPNDYPYSHSQGQPKSNYKNQPYDYPY